MCIYTIFSFICGGRKLKIAVPCPSFATNVQGLGFCRKDEVAHIDDGHNEEREFVEDTFGPGICSSVHCRRLYGLVPEREFHFEAKDLAEDDAPFTMTEDARAEREDRWYRQMLSTDQQLELINNTASQSNPGAASPSAKYFLSGEEDEIPHEQEADLKLDPDNIDWWELNPRYLNQYGLWIATSFLLPAQITDLQDQEHRSSSPFQPAFGPFKIKSHNCKHAKGVCKKCGRVCSRNTRGKHVYNEIHWTAFWAAPHLSNEELGLPHTKFIRPSTASTSTSSSHHSSPGHGEHMPSPDDQIDEQGDTLMFDD